MAGMTADSMRLLEAIVEALKSSTAEHGTQESLRLIDEALIHERRATVERAKADIRIWLSLHAAQMSADTLQAYADVDAMFDTMLEALDEGGP